MMSWGNVDIDRMSSLQAAKGWRYHAPDMPEFTGGKVTFQILGKQYTLLFSPDLTAGSWIPVGDLFIAHGGVCEYGFYEVSYTDKRFWRVSVGDVDSDSDGLADAEEHQLGSNPGLLDTDGDGLTDSEEVEIGTDPTNPDTDGDGLEDGTDADPKEILIAWEAASEASHILIDVIAPPDSDPADLNAKGEVLFDDGISSGGQWSALPEAEDEGYDQPFYSATSSRWTHLGDDGSISGESQYTINANGPDLQGVPMVMFAASGASALSTSASTPPGWELEDPDGTRNLEPLGVASGGRIFAQRTRLEADPRQRSLVVLDQGLEIASTLVFDAGHTIKKADVARNGSVIALLDTDSGTGTALELAAWDSSGAKLTVPSSQGNHYDLHATELAGGGTVMTAWSDSGVLKVYVPSESATMSRIQSFSASNIVLFAGDGTAMTDDHHLWRNGKLIPMRELCERFGELLDEGWYLQPLKSNKHGIYLIQADGSNGEKEAKIAARAEVRDEQFATGVDDVSRQAKKKNSDPGYEDDFWVMAPSGGDRTNETRMLIPHEAASLLKITPAATDASITTPNPFPLAVAIPKDSSTWPAVTWHGISATTKDADIDWHIGSPNHGQSATLPVKVKVMKGRTVKVAVWLVPCMTKNGAQSDPGFKPTKAQLDEYLNSVFKPQINVSFDCIVTETAVLDFDVEDGSGFGAPASTIEPHDGWLNTNNSGVAEFKTLRDNFEDDSVDINVYILGQYISGIKTSVRVTSSSPNFLATSPERAIGLTILNSRSIVIISNSMTTSGDWGSMKDTVAHEIGHVIIGAGHPDDIRSKPDGQVNWEFSGVAPLLGVDPTNRLMCGGLKRRDENATLLVKKEWDEAEKWLQENSDNRIRRERNLGRTEPTGNY